MQARKEGPKLVKSNAYHNLRLVLGYLTLLNLCSFASVGIQKHVYRANQEQAAFAAAFSNPSTDLAGIELGHQFFYGSSYFPVAEYNRTKLNKPISDFVHKTERKIFNSQ